MAIDLSPVAVEVAQRRGVRDARVLSITEIDERLAPIDTFVMMGNNFGLFGSASRTKRLLRRFHSIGSDRARVVAEVLDPYATDDPDHLAYHERNRPTRPTTRPNQDSDPPPPLQDALVRLPVRLPVRAPRPDREHRLVA